MNAFVPIMPVKPSSLSSSLCRPAVQLMRRMASPSAPGEGSSRRAVPVPPRAVMTEGEGGKTIDFSKVNMQEAGNNLAGLVFKPEEDAPLKTRVDVGYTSECEAGINGQINVEYTAMYAYHALWSYFDRDIVALPGFAKYFFEQSTEEREHAHEFMVYQNRRGGSVELQPIAVPEMQFTRQDAISDALYAMDLHLQLEKFVYKKLIELHKTAGDTYDVQMQDFIDDFLAHQVEAIKQAADYVSQIKRVGTPHGLYHFDVQLQEKYGKAA